VAATARSVYDLMVEAYGLVLLAVIVSKYVDYRRSQSIRRAQLKWLIYVLGLYLVFTMVTFGLIGTEGFNRTGLILDAMFSGLIPLAMTIAILRYRLYEIDRLVSRTVSYALVVVIVAAVFALPVILIPTAMGGSSDWVVAGATLAAAAVFNPVRRSIQTRVDRRFNRSRYDATREVEDLAARLSAAPASEPPIEDTVELVVRLLEPAAIGVWVRG
jgi:Kef-type K+ transport system membrane component KefB